MRKCMYMLVSMEVRGIRYPRAGVKGSCELPNVDAGCLIWVP